jgi:hypothetical protein
MTEQLIICPRCGSNACSEMSDGNIIIWQCMGCGFTSNSYLTEEYSVKYKELLPELYKALEFIDTKGLRWYPTAVTMDDKSMLFAEGTSIEDWKWAAVKSKKVSKKDKEKFKDATHVADMTSKKEFDEKDFMEALDYVGYFNKK